MHTPKSARKTAALLTVFALALGVCACGGSQENHGDAVPKQPKDGLTINNAAEPTTLDPQRNADTGGSAIIRQLLIGLVATDAEGNTVPALAESWEHKDQKIWTFHLREAKWSNGDPITADDVVYSLRRLTDPATAAPYGTYLADAKVENAEAIATGNGKPETLGVKALDAKTVQITLTAPVPYFPDMLTLSATYPVNRKAIEQYGDKWTLPGHYISSGAYLLKDWAVNSHVKLERNPGYYDNERTAIERITFLPISDATAELNRYKAGEIDITYGIPVDEYKQIKRTLADQLRNSDTLCSWYYEPNHDKAPFNNPKVRRALSLALDREILAYKVQAKGEQPAYQLTPTNTQGMKNNMPDWHDWTQEHRAKEAEKLLREAGYNEEKPLKFELLYPTSPAAKRIATATAALWRQAVGFIQVEPINQEFKTFQDTRNSGNFQIAYAGWCADYNEPSAFLNMLKSNNGNNTFRYRSHSYDKLLNETLSADATAAKRAELYQQAEAELDKDSALIPLFYSVRLQLVKPGVSGFSTKDPLANWQVKDWTFKQK